MIDREAYELALRTFTEEAARLGLNLSAAPDGAGWCLQGQGEGAATIWLPTALDVAVLLEQREEAMVAAAASAAIQAALLASKGGAA